ncbi:hypothetical protein GCM10022202_27910 [Microbacterium marinilacus]|uniref:C2H2-type domain-containing protein n=1 Tax=Microbacterium marinilacus TaxID=415209 RepID=A0ABP7BMJ1_9MICO
MKDVRVDLIFDGQCGFCTRSVNWIKRLDRHSRVHLHPSQRRHVRDRFGLTEDESRLAAWAFIAGQRSAGAGAINLALDAALGTRVFSALHGLPGMHWAQEYAYRWVSEHRYLLRGVAPWCSQHPDDCELAVEGATCSLPNANGGASRCAD